MDSPEQVAAPSKLQPLRAWIPLLLLPGMVVARFVPEWVQDGPSMIWMVSAFGPFLIGLAILGWWLILSRARWYERLIGFVGIVGSLVLVVTIADPSMRGPLITVMTIPMCMAGFAIGAILMSRKLSIQRTFSRFCWACGCELLGIGKVRRSLGKLFLWNGLALEQIR